MTCGRPCWVAHATLAGQLSHSFLTPLPHPQEVFDNISPDALALREAYNDASYFKEEAVRAFKLGVLSLEERAQVGSGGRGCKSGHGARVNVLAGWPGGRAVASIVSVACLVCGCPAPCLNCALFSRLMEQLAPASHAS